MKRVGVFEAKTHLSEIIDDGVALTITKHGVPVAVLTPVRDDARAVIARIRGMRRSAKPFAMATIVDETRAGRR